MKIFALIGAAGYIAPRHLKAIKDTGNTLVAALDKSDSVGILDAYFPEADFFTEFERFDRHLDKLKRRGSKVDFVSICSPNYLHDAHIRFALRHQADAICEKPLVLNPWNLAALLEMEKETGRRVYSILQLRLHPALVKLKHRVNDGPPNQLYKVSLNYVTVRGNWYQHSWKGDIQKSGGIATNIGIHFFDMLIWIFGTVQRIEEQHISNTKASGKLILRQAEVEWKLSLEYEDLPESIRSMNKRAFRSLIIDDEEVEFSDVFNDLHTLSYSEILKGNGFGLIDVKPSLDLVHQMRQAH